MENLVIQNKKQLFSRKIMALIWIVVGLIVLLTGKGGLMSKDDWLRAIAFFIIGAIHLTPLVGSSVAKITMGDGFIRILWLNWIRTVTVQENEIEGIVIAQKGVSIKRKGKKPVKILFFLLEKDQIRQVIDFFTEYARQKNLI